MATINWWQKQQSMLDEEAVERLHNVVRWEQMKHWRLE